jgi:hypothetical protein
MGRNGALKLIDIYAQKINMKLKTRDERRLSSPMVFSLKYGKFAGLLKVVFFIGKY